MKPFALWVAVATATLSLSTISQTITSEDVEMSTISGPVDQPRRHFRLRNAKHLNRQEAGEIYEIVVGALRRGYARSSVAAAHQYQGWRQYNAYPYRSATHGNHYLNNYANAVAARYGAFEEAGPMPVGSIVVKDSFAVTETGGILLGPLFVMEKMPEGFNYASGDWKYSLIGPDGAVMGETNTSNAKAVEYCVSCHLAVEEQDHLYFIPPAARISQ